MLQFRVYPNLLDPWADTGHRLPVVGFKPLLNSTELKSRNPAGVPRERPDIAARSKVSLYDVTATVQYKIWKGLVGRLEYRHDSADEKVFKIRTPGLAPTSKSLDTVSVSLFYSFF